MWKKLTKRAIDALTWQGPPDVPGVIEPDADTGRSKRKPDPNFLWDSELRGFGCRV